MSELILTPAAAASMLAVGNSLYLSKAYVDYLKLQKETQEAQGKMATTLAQNEKATIQEQAQSERHSATSTAVQGGFSAGSSIGGGLSRLRTAPEAGIANVNNARSLLETGNAVRGAGPVAANNLTIPQIEAQLRGFDYKTTIAPGSPVESALGQLRTLRNAEVPVAGVPGAASRLYNSTMKDIKLAERDARNIQETHQRNLDLVDNRLSNVGQGMGTAFGSISQFQAAESRNKQAEAQAEQQYAQFANDSMGQDVQTQGKTADAIQAALLEAMRNETTALAAATSA